MKEPHKELNELQCLTVPETARVLGISKKKAWLMVWSGELPSLRIGKCVRVRAVTLRDWIRERTVRQPEQEVTS